MKLEVSTEELRKYSIFIGTPMYGGQCSGMFTKSTNDLSMLCAKHQIPLKYYFLFNESLVQRARNYIVDEFMRSDCTHLMFIDSDIGFNPRDVLALLAMNIQDKENMDVVTGPYPKKTIAWEKVSKASELGLANDNPFKLENYTSDFVFNPVKGMTSFKLGEPVEVSEAGTGFMLITREALEKYRDSYPELSYKPDHIRTDNFDGTREITAFFDCVIDPNSKRYLSEDYFFCRKAREIGLKIWMCPWMQINHVGSYIFKGNMGSIGQLGVSATADKTSNRKSYKPVDKSSK
jgi:hypothetical protein